MSGLCHNRAWDGNSFGPRYEGRLTTCFEDVVLLPIAAWFLLVLAIPSVLLIRLARTPVENPPSPKWWGFLSDNISGAIIGLYIHEMTQLQHLHLGIGLLPFLPIGIVLAIVLMHIHVRIRKTNFILITLFIFWVLLAILTEVKLHTLVHIDHQGFKRQGSKFTTANQITDYVIIFSLVIISAIITVMTPFVPPPPNKDNGVSGDGGVTNEMHSRPYRRRYNNNEGNAIA